MRRVFERGWAMVVVIFCVYWLMATHGKHSDTGDEPHYLMVTQSLVADGDFDLRNNYAEHQGRRFGADDLEAGPHVHETTAGQLFPVHDVGLPVALVPVYALATALSSVPSAAWLERFRMTPGELAYALISFFVIGLMTAAASIMRSALLADGLSARAATIVTLAVWLAPPVLANSSSVFPEVVALLATALFVQVVVSPAPTLSRLRIGVCFALVACLPWFHRKYLPYSAALFVSWLWLRRAEVSALPWTRRGLLVGLALVPSVLLATWTWLHWHNLGGPLALDGVPLSWHVFQTGALGLLVDRENGLFVWAPIFLFVLAAWALDRERRILLLPAVILYGLSAAHDQWWAGFSPTGRFLVPLVPLFVILTARQLRWRALRVAVLIALVPEICIAAYGWIHTRALWPTGNGDNRVVGPLLQAVHLNQTLLPSLRTSSPGIGRALAVVVGILVANAAVAAAAWRERQATESGHRPHAI